MLWLIDRRHGNTNTAKNLYARGKCLGICTMLISRNGDRATHSTMTNLIHVHIYTRQSTPYTGTYIILDETDLQKKRHLVVIRQLYGHSP